MNEPELHDLSDDADYAASIQQGFTHLNRTEEYAGILYTKDNVGIHPTQYASVWISGRLKLIRHGNSIFMTWIPYKGQSAYSTLSEKDKSLSTIQAIPFSDVLSIRRHTPTLGWQYITVVMSSGLAYTPLHFYDGGVQEFLSTIQKHFFLILSGEDANVFLVYDFQNPLLHTLSSLELPRAVSVADVPSPSHAANEQEKDDSTKISVIFHQNGRLKENHYDPVRNLSIQKLEKFSLVTSFAHETTSQIFRDSNRDGLTPTEATKKDRSFSEYKSITTSNNSERIPDQVALSSGPLELPAFFDSEGRVMEPKGLTKRLFDGGVGHNMVKEAWRILLEYHSYDSSSTEAEWKRQYLVSLKKLEYETIKGRWKGISPVQPKRYIKLREHKELIQNDVVRTAQSTSFFEGDDNPNVHLLLDILLTYTYYNLDLGYCQGMSDLLSPILFVMRDESKSFWCFVSLIERLGNNFNRDQSWMHPQHFALSKFDKVSLVSGRLRRAPLGHEEWSTFFDSEGRVMDPKELTKRIFCGGVERSMRKEAWTFLLGYHSYDSTEAEREHLVSVKKSKYERLKNIWKDIPAEIEGRWDILRKYKGLIENDVVRTARSMPFFDGNVNTNVDLLRDILLTHTFYNFNLGYYQGMSDLLSPILFVMRDESKSFWCFVSLMERLGPNFNRDQIGMHSQLFALSKLVELLDTPLHNYFKQNGCLNYFFCFRWILVQFKRKFDYEKTMRLWEVLWTHYPSEHFHLYICVSILKKHRNKIMNEQMSFDSLLKFCDELGDHIDLDETLIDAVALCLCAAENGVACIPPGTPPSLPVGEQAML